MSAPLHVALLAPPGVALDAFAQLLVRRLALAPLGLRVSVAGEGAVALGTPLTAPDLLLHTSHRAAVPTPCTHALLVTGDGAPAPAEDTLRAALLASPVRWSVVRGLGEVAVESALDALTPWLLRTLGSAGSAGLFSRLAQREAAQPAWRWVCETCDAPECEHASLQARRRAAGYCRPDDPGG
jgi:hypothetical protein